MLIHTYVHVFIIISCACMLLFFKKD